MTGSDQLERYSPAGLLIRYARGRRAHFWNRQIMTALGAIVLAIVNGPMWGLFAAGLALLGEAVDLRVLRNVPERLARGETVAQVTRTCVLASVFQATTISGCVALSWFGPNSHQGQMFALAFLMGTSVSAGLMLPFNKPSSVARLLVYGFATVAFFVHDGQAHHHDATSRFMEVSGALIMAYLVYMFLNHVVAGYRRSESDTRDLIRKGRALEQANDELFQRQKEARRLSLVAKNANDTVILTDPQGRILWINDAFCRSTGYRPDEVVGRIPGQFLIGPDSDLTTLGEMAQAVKQGQPYRGEVENRTKSGGSIWLDVNIVPVRSEDGEVEVFVAIARDITDARQLAQDMEAARIAAEEGARAKAEFLATMSHEIRTPMNGVIGMAELLAETPMTPDQTSYVRTIRSSAEALLKVINDVLDLSKLEAGKVQLSPVEFDPRDVLQDAVRLLGPQAQDKGLHLNVDICADLPARLCADDGRMRQILLNLIGNAIKFTETGGVTVRMNAIPSGSDTRLIVAVEDTGIGIPADKLEGIFDSFSQADSATTRKFGGTGLGLTISRRLAEAMGGRLHATSTPGKGSCFVVSLLAGPAQAVPRQAQRQAPAQQHLAPKPEDPATGGAETAGSLTGVADQASADQASVDRGASELSGPDQAADLSGLRVLVAEDNKVNRLLIDKYLARQVGALSFAHDGQQAVHLHARERPDVILMDMSMPVLNGLDATREIRAANGKQPRIVALTANAFASDRAACLEAGMDHFLTKPVRKADLLRCLAGLQAELGGGKPFESSP